ncbi:MAG TPA: hypothetical protein VNP04_07240 [Alphaproteobacteria bacterium]|nr:hypothetical protein [Alphaproteobacteria bacterium]
MPDRTDTVDVRQALIAEINETETMLKLAEEAYGEIQRRRLERGEPGPLVHVIARAPGEAKVVHRLAQLDRDMIVDLCEGELLESIQADRAHLQTLRKMLGEIEGKEEHSMARRPQYITATASHTEPPAPEPEASASEGPSGPLLLAAREAFEAAAREEMALHLAHMPRRRAIDAAMALIRQEVQRVQATLAQHASAAELLAASQKLELLAEQRQALAEEREALAAARVQAGERMQAARAEVEKLQAEYRQLMMELQPGQRQRWSGEVLAAKIRRLAELVGDGLPAEPGIDAEHYLTGIEARERAAVARLKARQAMAKEEAGQ